MYVAHCKLHWPSAHARGSQLGWHQDSLGVRGGGGGGGVRHQFTPLSAKKAFATLEVCFGLFCIKRWPFSYSGRWRVGRRATCTILTYIAASIIPSKMQISVAPCHPIPAHTWTLTGCLHKIVMKVRMSPFKTLFFICLANKLTVRWPLVRPAESMSGTQNRAEW